MRLDFENYLKLDCINTTQLINTYEFAHSFYQTLSSKVNVNDSLQQIFLITNCILQHMSFRNCYLTDCFDSFCYETTLNIYNSLRIYDYLHAPSTTASACLKLYTKNAMIDKNINDLQHELTDIKKELLLKFNTQGDQNYEQLSYALNKHNIGKTKSYFSFYDFWNHSLPHNAYKFNPLTAPEDFYILLKSYTNSIYKDSNYSRGIQLHTMYNLIDEYLRYYLQTKQDDIPKNEHRIYQLEYLYHPIQFFNCVYSFFNQPFVENGIPDDYGPLVLYTKLFDIPSISFSNYFLAKYSDDFRDFYTDTYKRLKIGINFHDYAAYYLPIISSSIRYLLLHSEKKYDIPRLKEMCENYIIYEYNRKPELSYYSHLQKIKDSLDVTTYPTEKKLKISDSAKTETSEYSFGRAISTAYFTTSGFNDCHTYPRYQNIPLKLEDLRSKYISNFNLQSSIYDLTSYKKIDL